jgi:hypothetical protein
VRKISRARLTRSAQRRSRGEWQRSSWRLRRWRCSRDATLAGRNEELHIVKDFRNVDRRDCPCPLLSSRLRTPPTNQCLAYAKGVLSGQRMSIQYEDMNQALSRTSEKNCVKRVLPPPRRVRRVGLGREHIGTDDRGIRCSPVGRTLSAFAPPSVCTQRRWQQLA